jgi:hypothetical protein
MFRAEWESLSETLNRGVVWVQTARGAGVGFRQWARAARAASGIDVMLVRRPRGPPAAPHPNRAKWDIFDSGSLGLYPCWEFTHGWRTSWRGLFGASFSLPLEK